MALNPVGEGRRPQKMQGPRHRDLRSAPPPPRTATLRIARLRQNREDRKLLHDGWPSLRRRARTQTQGPRSAAAQRQRRSGNIWSLSLSLSFSLFIFLIYSRSDNQRGTALSIGHCHRQNDRPLLRWDSASRRSLRCNGFECGSDAQRPENTEFQRRPRRH